MANSKIKNPIRVVRVTGTTGTGESTGALVVNKSIYAGVDHLIPFGQSYDLTYRVALAQETSTAFVFAVSYSTTGAWASGASVTFYAFAM